jgi:hypothetical protein
VKRPTVLEVGHVGNDKEVKTEKESDPARVDPEDQRQSHRWFRTASPPRQTTSGSPSVAKNFAVPRHAEYEYFEVEAMHEKQNAHAHAKQQYS